MNLYDRLKPEVRERIDNYNEHPNLKQFVLNALIKNDYITHVTLEEMQDTMIILNENCNNILGFYNLFTD